MSSDKIVVTMKNMFESLFLEQYELLNPEQREAVDTIEGPVMVIAGPGTGKTQVLSMRIANMLRSDAQIDRRNILCLTYTEEGAVAMKQRLAKMIGPQAHDIQISTFHGFCNMVVQEHLQLFGIRELEPLSEYESTKIIHHILDHLPSDNSLRRLKGNIYYETNALRHLFSFMKKENWTVDKIKAKTEEELATWKESPDAFYKTSGKNFKKGDFKQKDYDQLQLKLQKFVDAAGLFDEYERLKSDMNRYDFDDMLLWVNKAFEEQPYLLQLYQERFQYIMVDEFQDTSEIQLSLLYHLISYFDVPNVFVVGDDDQCIYEFQNARLENTQEFIKRYLPYLKVISLRNNYRSTQVILNAAMTSIENNQNRLNKIEIETATTKDETEKVALLKRDKVLVSALPKYADGQLDLPIQLLQFKNPIQQSIGIVEEIKKLAANGVAYNDIAILCREHKHYDDIIKILDSNNMPYWVKQKVNILNEPIIKQLIDLLRWIDMESDKSYSGDALLFRMLHAPYHGIDLNDVAQLSFQLEQKDSRVKYFRQAISNGLLLESLNMASYKAMLALGQRLEQFLQQLQVLRLPMLMEHILYDLGILQWISQQKDAVWLLQVINTFVDTLQKVADKRPETTIKEWLQLIDDYNAMAIGIPIEKTIGLSHGVKIYTLHSSKGHEFEYVFMPHMTAATWEDKRSGNTGFSLPKSITKENNSDSSDKNESNRRLFFVGITRAKRGLYLCYPANTNDDKALNTSKFIDEIREHLQEHEPNIPVDILQSSFIKRLSPNSPLIMKQASHAILQVRVEQVKMSATSLNQYLKCPVNYYWTNILKMPQVKNDSLGYGIAMHKAVELLYSAMKDVNDSTPITLEQLIKWFEQEMYRQKVAFTDVQFERRLELGKNVLENYFNNIYPLANKAVDVERFFRDVYVDGVPVTGKIDKIEMLNDYRCTVVDYKTGNPKYILKSLKPPANDEDLGGDYWRQIVFYKLMMLNHPAYQFKDVQEGRFEILDLGEQNKLEQFIVPVTNQDSEVVKQQLKKAYEQIQAMAFSTGCNDPSCHACQMVKAYNLEFNTEA